MSVDIRMYTRVIIRKNGEYLQCRDVQCKSLIWSNSPYHAWWTRNKDDAMDVARKTGGVMVLFNPVAGRTAFL